MKMMQWLVGLLGRLRREPRRCGGVAVSVGSQVRRPLTDTELEDELSAVGDSRLWRAVLQLLHEELVEAVQDAADERVYESHGRLAGRVGEVAGLSRAVAVLEGAREAASRGRRRERGGREGRG